MKWLKRLFKPSCVCCGTVAYNNLDSIPLGEHILYDLVVSKRLSVSHERLSKILFKYQHTHLANYPLCDYCHAVIKAMAKEDQDKRDALSIQKKEKLEVANYYKELEIAIKRKELHAQAAALGIDLNMHKQQF